MSLSLRKICASGCDKVSNHAGVVRPLGRVQWMGMEVILVSRSTHGDRPTGRSARWQSTVLVLYNLPLIAAGVIPASRTVDLRSAKLISAIAAVKYPVRSAIRCTFETPNDGAHGFKFAFAGDFTSMAKTPVLI
jgi:hypothetical protein